MLSTSLGLKEYQEYQRLFDIAENLVKRGFESEANHYYEKAQEAYYAYEYASGIRSVED